MENDISNNRYTQQILNLSKVLGLGEPRVSGNDLNMLCPFHKESNPSFGISTKTGEYNCFACGAKGHISKITKNLREHITGEKIDHIEDFKVSSKIDTVSFSKKPSKSDVSAIRKRLLNISLSEYTIEKLLEFITTGHTVSLSGANKNKDWQGQQVVMIDLDNEYSSTFTEILDYAKSVDLEPTFAYQTYSSTEDVCRCRLAYVFTEPITDKQLYLSIYDMLVRKFEDFEVDKSCKDLCRLFYGSMNKDYYIGNLLYSTRFSEEQLKKIDNIVNENNSTKNSSSKKLNHNTLAKDLISQYHIIKLNGLPYLYDSEEGIYIEGLNSRNIETIIVQNYPTLDIRHRAEIIEDIILLLGKNQEVCDYHYIGFQNGVLFLDLMELKPFSPDIIITSKLTVNYVPHLFDSNYVVDNFFNSICKGDQGIIDLMYRIIGVSCCATNKFHKTFVFYGNRWQW